MTSVLPYSPQHYSSLPSIEDASETLTSDAVALLTSAIGHVFVKHQVQKLFGIVLLHNHFTLKDDEILVNFGSVAVPWKTTSSAKQLLDVKGSAWRFTKDGLVPYEFTHYAYPAADIGGFQSFLSELRDLLCSFGLVEKLGICALQDGVGDRAPQVEFTQGRANITLPFDIDPTEGPDNSIEASWEFESPSESNSK
ncbi:hypothetical protein DCS_00944 [Drechmeria coniospora]|uniref:Uncharacterized protein n=1 Tax=Drechmeria coniospora TaxID=98403 RepID=A0A151GRU5_DRECN|nr:hypothetical protein DCS_00944 [Drechmeria coniospora]KYK59810.1 hypothetical protein DCS_00944 [Drechmeria coniospora]ODA78863.1 hypothetical protein RJ55_06247 [Drechmeria coniospora]